MDVFLEVCGAQTWQKVLTDTQRRHLLVCILSPDTCLTFEITRCQMIVYNRIVCKVMFHVLLFGFNI